MEENRLLIFGAGGHGRVVAELATAAGWHVVAFIDDDAAQPKIAGHPALGSDTLADRSKADCIVVAIGNDKVRQTKAQELRTQGWNMPTLIHPTAIVAPSAKLGANTVVMAGAIIQTDASIGNDVIINSGASVDHDADIGNATQICPGAHLAGTVTTGERAFIGTGASVIPGMTIGRDVKIGAGAVVIKDVADGTTAVGTPAEPIKRKK